MPNLDERSLLSYVARYLTKSGALETSKEVSIDNNREFDFLQRALSKGPILHR